MLRDAAQYERAKREVCRLEAKIKAGTATPEDRARATAGAEEIVCWEWEQEWNARRSVRGAA